MKSSDKKIIDKSKACLIMGAIGDALGAPVEFMSYEQIQQNFGDTGILRLSEAYGNIGSITDDTQMTLACADGLLSAYRRGSERGILGDYWKYTAQSYAKWLETQGIVNKNFEDFDGWGSQSLFELLKKQGQRAPGNTCISALTEMDQASVAKNDSKGCGTVMRAAPIGIFFVSSNWQKDIDLESIYKQGMEDAAITHGHITAHHASGILAVIVAQCLEGEALDVSIEKALESFGSKDVSDICKRAIELSKEKPSAKALESIGKGWIAEEALAMSIYCALQCTNNNIAPIDALRLAVNHGGDSDSTGSITGNLIGISLGSEAIPRELLPDDSEVKSMLDILSIYGEELVTLPPSHLTRAK